MNKCKLLFILIFISGLFLPNESICFAENQHLTDSLKIRKPRYYTGAEYINKEIDPCLKNATIERFDGELLGIIIPHDFKVSNNVAAESAVQLTGRKINTVVILCNSHRGFFKGIAIDDSDIWENPLGSIRTDKVLAQKLIDGDTTRIIEFNGAPHRTDHTTELILPFLKKTISTDFKIVPIVFGNSFYMGRDINEDYKVLSDLLLKNLGPHDIIVVSNDMTHFLTKEEIETIDERQLEIFQTADVQSFVRYEHELASKEGMNNKILSCAKDGLKTIFDLYQSFGGGQIKILAHDIADCGFSSAVLFTNSRSGSKSSN